jgi:hypothetical protein
MIGRSNDQDQALMDVFVIVDSHDHPAYRRPYQVANALTAEHVHGWQVRSVTVLDRSTGLLSIYRSE